MTSVTRH